LDFREEVMAIRVEFAPSGPVQEHREGLHPEWFARAWPATLYDVSLKATRGSPHSNGRGRLIGGSLVSARLAFGEHCAAAISCNSQAEFVKAVLDTDAHGTVADFGVGLDLPPFAVFA
jgi:hypothetical protein